VQIKESIDEYSLAHSWIICNKDSSYYKSDTLFLYNHINYYYDPSNCCNFVKWEFENATRYRLTETKMCQEPPIALALVNNLYRLSWKIENDNLYLSIENRELNYMEMFKVCDFYEEQLWNKIHKSMVLKMIRTKTCR
jgi:hypothetical protein